VGIGNRVVIGFIRAFYYDNFIAYCGISSIGCDVVSIGCDTITVRFDAVVVRYAIIIPYIALYCGA
jgi:hypothetical protein